MKPIKRKTYYNFMRVVRMIEAKGYDFDESCKTAHRIFEQYEFCPGGLTVLQLVSMIVPNNAAE